MQKLPITELLYLQDPKRLSAHCQLVAVDQTPSGETAIVLDRTPFFPGGGGQKPDEGNIEWPSGRMMVRTVLQDTGKALHVGRLDGDDPVGGQQVTAVVSASPRRLNDRIHSAGELVCAAMRQIDNRWLATGAKHYPGDSRVLFNVMLDAGQREQLKNHLNDLLCKMIAEDHRVVISTTSDPEHVERVCGYRPDYLPKGEPVRLVTVYGPFGRPCMGTHVDRLSEIGMIEITSIKAKKGDLAISYAVR